MLKFTEWVKLKEAEFVPGDGLPKRKLNLQWCKKCQEWHSRGHAVNGKVYRSTRGLGG